MGGALLEAWLEEFPHFQFTVLDHAEKRFDVEWVQNASALEGRDFDIVVLAVKPQTLADVASELDIPAHATVVSIMAGVGLDALTRYFGDSRPLVRTMPNLPAQVGLSMTVAQANDVLSREMKQQVAALFEACGALEWIEDESLFDAVTAVSGSGPAYVFHMIEVLAQSGEALGLEPDFAYKLAKQTVIGAAAMAGKSDLSASTLRENVTSKGGTTAAALAVLQDGRLQEIYDAALQAAQQRSKELNS